MRHLVYETTCLDTGKHYVGVHKTNNIHDGYLGSGKLLKQAITKYGPERFVRRIIKYCRSSKAAYALEAAIVTSKFVTSRRTYNVALGGNGGAIQSKQGLISLSTSKMGNNNPFYGITGKNHPSFGTKRTKASKKKMSISKLNQPVLICPHCGLGGKGGAMQRWHFDNCKQLKEK